jgi:hypothetical protein
VKAKRKKYNANKEEEQEIYRWKDKLVPFERPIDD